LKNIESTFFFLPFKIFGTSAILQVEMHRKNLPNDACCLALAVGIVFFAKMNISELSHRNYVARESACEVSFSKGKYLKTLQTQ
jgi:hypothetical protein